MATVPVLEGEPGSLAEGVSKRVLRLLKAQVEDWQEVCRNLTNWEDQYLVEEPTPERVAEHSRMLDELERVGTWIAGVTTSAGFPDRALAELVGSTLQDLRDARALWHGNVSKERRQEILRAVFNES